MLTHTATPPHRAETAPADTAGETITGFARDQLRSFIERIERLAEEKKAIGDDIKDVYAEAKANGFDVKALRAILKLRGEDMDKVREHEAIVDLYLSALGIMR